MQERLIPAVRRRGPRDLHLPKRSLCAPAYRGAPRRIPGRMAGKKVPDMAEYHEWHVLRAAAEKEKNVVAITMTEA